MCGVSHISGSLFRKSSEMISLISLIIGVTLGKTMLPDSEVIMGTPLTMIILTGLCSQQLGAYTLLALIAFSNMANLENSLFETGLLFLLPISTFLSLTSFLNEGF